MPLGKYYCDYCEKEFQDTPFARKRHLQGIQHQRNKALWFDSVNRGVDPASSSANFVKGVCNRFVKTGFCPYGDSCKYVHPKQNMHSLNAQGAPITGVTDNLEFQLGGNSFQGEGASRSFGMSLGDLPPSLRPPPEGGYPPLPFVDWG
ncbi:hypothetical protein Nepgr_001640 [Nepenthes gracilis]|uniref:C3H1-type domain-containing protein n=1 Tax=Nepenthes gracilis TaxID=150966 RepID=A0AAD3P4U4_NEPGR|nr:hypothetical protein Nepgr_001640 [Nepenthes gracilis]